MTHTRIASLIVKHQRDELSSSEQLELNEWRHATPANREHFDLLTDPERVARDLADFSSIDVEGARRKVARRIRTRNRIRIALYVTSILLIIAVASILYLWRRL